MNRTFNATRNLRRIRRVMELIHLPLTAVADARGWKDNATLLPCYQEAASELVRAPGGRTARPLVPDDPTLKRADAIRRRAADDIERVFQPTS